MGVVTFFLTVILSLCLAKSDEWDDPFIRVIDGRVEVFRQTLAVHVGTATLWAADANITLTNTAWPGGEIVLAGGSRLTLPAELGAVNVSRTDTDVVHVVSTREVNSPSNDAGQTAAETVCTYDDATRSFLEAECEDGRVEKATARLVIQSASHTVNAKTAGVWASCDVVGDDLGGTVTIRSGRHRLAVAGELRVAAAITRFELVGAVNIGVLVVCSATPSLCERHPGQHQTGHSSPHARRPEHETRISKHGLEAAKPGGKGADVTTIYCVYNEDGYTDKKKCPPVSMTTPNLLRVHARYNDVTLQWYEVEWYYQTKKERCAVQASYLMTITGYWFYFEDIKVTGTLKFNQRPT